jgi:anti-sigma B factor antagonist
MDITTTDNQIELNGRFDAHEVPGFTAAVEPLLEAGSGDLSVDLAKVEFIDSSALAALVATSKALTGSGRGFAIANPSDPVQVIFELTGLDKAFECVFTTAAS